MKLYYVDWVGGDFKNRNWFGSKREAISFRADLKRNAEDYCVDPSCNIEIQEAEIPTDKKRLIKALNRYADSSGQ